MEKILKSLSEIKFLIVEDDDNNLFLIKKLLQMSGVPGKNIYSFRADPLADLDEIEVNFDIVFLDIHLPKKDGYLIIKEMRGHPKTTDSLIIALSASVMGQDIKMAKAAGFDGFIGKPIDGRKFSENLNHIIRGEDVWIVM